MQPIQPNRMRDYNSKIIDNVEHYKSVSKEISVVLKTLGIASKKDQTDELRLFTTNLKEILVNKIQELINTSEEAIHISLGVAQHNLTLRGSSGTLIVEPTAEFVSSVINNTISALKKSHSITPLSQEDQLSIVSLYANAALTLITLEEIRLASQGKTTPKFLAKIKETTSNISSNLDGTLRKIAAKNFKRTELLFRK